MQSLYFCFLVPIPGRPSRITYLNYIPKISTPEHIPNPPNVKNPLRPPRPRVRLLPPWRVQTLHIPGEGGIPRSTSSPTLEPTFVTGYATPCPRLFDDILLDPHIPDLSSHSSLVERDAKGDEPLIATIHVDSSDTHCHFYAR